MLNELFKPENTLHLDYRILSVVATLLCISLIFFILATKRFLRGKILTASIQGLSALTLCLAGLLSLSIALNLYSYDRLSYEQVIAQLVFEQVDKQQFQVKISYENGKNIDNFLIKGDEWQIDARIIKWQSWAQLLGLHAQYRLQRIGGRYSNIEAEREKPRTVYALGPKDNIDYWRLINQSKRYLPWINAYWVDAYYGSAAYLPMTNNAIYEVSLTQNGLIARPLDEKTKDKIKFW